MAEHTELILQGNATDQIWCMRTPDGRIGLRLDAGDAGYVSLTPEQARAVIVSLENMLRSTSAIRVPPVRTRRT